MVDFAFILFAIVICAWIYRRGYEDGKASREINNVIRQSDQLIREKLNQSESELINLVTDDQGRVRCPICGKKQKGLNGIKAHMRAIHPDHPTTKRFLHGKS